MPAGRPRRPTTRPNTTTTRGAVRQPLRTRRLRRRLRRRPVRTPQPRHRWPRRSPSCATSTTAAPQGADPDDGDGAGILTQIPHELYREACGFALPDAGRLRRGHRVPARPTTPSAPRRSPTHQRIAAEEGLTVLGWRDVPVDPRTAARWPARPCRSSRQLFLDRPPGTATEGLTGIDLERRAYCLRKRAEHEAGVYFASLSPRTIIYKGMLTTPQLEPFFPDLSDPATPRPGAGALAVLHQHLPVLAAGPPLPLHRPQRRDQHRQGQPQLDAGPRGDARQRPHPRRPRRLFPIVDADGQRHGALRRGLELLHLGGRSLPHAVLMMIPEAWENHTEMDPARRAFYEFHSTLMEPWDGPACVTFTDGTVIGAVLDRNGLRPGRYWVTDDGLVVLASEVGVLDIDPAKVVRKGRLQPGRMFLVDTAQRPHRRGRRGQGRAGRRAPVRGVAARRPGRASTTCPSREHVVPRRRRRSCAASRPSATPRRSCGSC